MQHQRYDKNSVYAHPEFMVNIDDIEALTGIDLFPNLPDDVENAVEGITITNNILNDWGFSLEASSDTYDWTYHNPVSTVTTTMLSDQAYATFYNDQPKTLPDGLSAYIATSRSETSVRMTELQGNVIPARCGVMLCSESGGNYSLTDAETKATDDVSGNLMVGWTTDHAITGSSDISYYAMNYGNDNKAGFFAPKGAGTPNGSFTAKAGKAYLKLEATSSAKVSIEWEEPTGIEDLTSDSPGSTSSPTDGTYNLQGMRVNDQYRGIVVINGKKYIKQ